MYSYRDGGKRKSNHHNLVFHVACKIGNVYTTYFITLQSERITQTLKTKYSITEEKLINPISVSIHLNKSMTTTPCETVHPADCSVSCITVLKKSACPAFLTV